MYHELNMAVLAAKFENLHNNIQNIEAQLVRSDIGVENAKTGALTLFLKAGKNKQYAHSRYDPENEASQWIAEYESQMDEYDHIIFYGIGLGYHVEWAAERFPNKTITLYEPNPYIFYQYLINGGLHRLPMPMIKQIYVDFVKQMSAVNLPELINTLQSRALIIVNPAYRRLFQEDTANFENQFKEALISKRNSLNTNNSYQRIWIANSLHNFHKVLETPNILREKKDVFEKKPVILVSAGPSLSEEFENLRYIKENKLAYIFAVGSANRALVNQGIYPDAVTSYDPTYINYTVFQEIIDQDIKEIPLIFGSSGNYKTVQLYPGPQLHMFINQDTISPYFIGNELAEKEEILLDAPSIAVVTLELLHRLGADPIIMVGQNFAYRNEEYFAKGIHYDFRPSTVTEQEKQDIVMVESVDGGQVATGRSHIMAKSQMENYLQTIATQRTVWNTTKGGAKIEGAAFKSLDSIMKEALTAAVVDPRWHEGPRTEYDWTYIKQQAELLYEEHDKLAEIIDDLVKMLLKIKAVLDHRQLHKLERMFLKFDNRMTEMLNNKYYRVFLRPMTRTMFEAAEKTAADIRAATNLTEKGKLVLDRFGSFMEQTRELYSALMPLYFNLNQIIAVMMDNEIGATENSSAETTEAPSLS